MLSADIMLEKPGLITVSEALSKKLGLMPGMSLVVEDTKDGVRLRVKTMPPHLSYENHVLVFAGELINPVADPVLDDRDERMNALI